MIYIEIGVERTKVLIPAPYRCTLSEKYRLRRKWLMCQELQPFKNLMRKIREN